MEDLSNASSTSAREAGITKAQKHIDHVRKSYDDGTILFSRATLEDIDRQFACAEDYVLIDDFDGIPKKHSIKASPSFGDDWYIPRIHYNSIEALTTPSPHGLEYDFMAREDPLSIVFVGPHEKPSYSLVEASRELEQHRSAWSESSTCTSLTSTLSSATFPILIEKIVCFGLGSLRDLSGQAYTRSYWQHLAAKTMANALATTDGPGIPCYCQDPVYDEFDKQILQSLGIVLLDDPRGFLAVSSKTLVFSVSPNVPVKQIVSDVEWPSAMLWNTVEPPEQDELEWRRERIQDEEVENWIAPYTTDPDSPRVRSMITHYDQHTFQDYDNKFGDLTLYIRKSTDRDG